MQVGNPKMHDGLNLQTQRVVGQEQPYFPCWGKQWTESG
jgi:hypothetical protein